ncbi:sensor histidine kinase [Occultella glacieicola]|uniref:Sensor histidine kinase n=1 Tax=Occultella glacieicola TaxID=2518684 RepID=A0ABY2E6U8_9MICO|nr:histidine kinase [Occultella glacieicola]TDE95784.1 sensor histidine kinase [Occultella glacieicola]
MNPARTSAGAIGLAGWSRASNPQRFETYNRWTLYFLLAFEPVFALMLFSGSTEYTGAGALAFLVASTVHCALAIMATRACLGVYLGRAGSARRELWLLAVGTPLTVGAAIFWAGSSANPSPIATGFAAAIAPVIAVLAVSPLLSAGRLVLVSVIVGPVAAVLATMIALGPATAAGGVIPLVISTGLVAVGAALSFRISVWMIGVVWEQEQRRAVDARLAVAEERLRFSRDLHDVFGRTLSTVAVKSELAAELARRGDDRAPDQMLEVRRIAQDALREVRAVVDGYRAADLPTEVAGAREILRSAGVDVLVAGEGTDLPPRSQEALAWVVREAVTNVVRHADADRCVIELRASPDAATLRISNDGARPADAARVGAGLNGLRERLATLGGTLDVHRNDTEFTLIAVVPLVGGPPVPPTTADPTPGATP